jgi:hypothetical protein
MTGFLGRTTRVWVTGSVLFASSVTAQTDLAGLHCLPPPYDDRQTQRQAHIGDLVDWLRSRLDPYPPLAGILVEEPPEICLAERLIGAQGYYEVETHRIALRRALSAGMMRAVAIHELRHIHQARLGVCPGPELSMQATAGVVLAMEADASAVSLAIAWELEQAGEPEVWSALANWRSHAPLAQAFAAEMRESGDLARATGAAFSAWYEIDWMRETYYVAACSAYLDSQDATHALPSYGALDPAFLERLCILPNGTAYPCDAAGRTPEAGP